MSSLRLILIGIFIISIKNCTPARAENAVHSIEIEPRNSSTLLDSITKKWNQSAIDAELNKILSREGPDLRSSSNYHDFEDITIEHATRAWSLLREKALEVVNARIDKLWPELLDSLLSNAKISASCKEAINITMSAARSLDSWAIKMLNAWGNFPPIGLMDGVYSDIGSFQGCLNIDLSESTYADKLGHPQFCTVSFRPVIPSRTHFHKIITKEREFVDRFRSSEFYQAASNNSASVSPIKKDIFYDLVENAQYFHYIYIKTGICTPSACRPHDLKIIVKHIGFNASIMAGPVKCHVNHGEQQNILIDTHDNLTQDTVRGHNLLIVQGKMSDMQKIALSLLGGILIIVLIASLCDAAVMLAFKQDNYSLNLRSNDSNATTANNKFVIDVGSVVSSRTYWISYIKDFSLVENFRQFIELEITKKNEITCLNGLRSITMIWIIVVHSLQYNDWSGFSRIHQIEKSLVDPMSQPILNANYLVDTFFLISGLLTTYSIWNSISTQKKSNFSCINHLIGRYLRLTPQVFISGLLFIIMPLLNSSGSPHWYESTHQFSENCQKNLWINMFHLQSFYKSDEICNLVSWWISVDMFYHLIGLVLICMLIRKKKILTLSSGIFIVLIFIYQAIKIHISMKFTPNMFATVPQIGEVWSDYVIGYFWSPYPHSFSFFYGLWLGYMMATNQKDIEFVDRYHNLGWSLCLATLALVSFSNHWWLNDTLSYTALVAALFNQFTPILWSLCIGWIITSCHFKWDSIFNRILSCGLFVVLNKASYIIYLSHMIVVCFFYGSQNLLLEVSQLMLYYIIIGNVFISVLFGSILCVLFEMPFLGIHRRVMKVLRK